MENTQNKLQVFTFKQQQVDKVYIDNESAKYRVMQLTAENSWLRDDLFGKEGYIVCEYIGLPFKEAKPQISYVKAQQDLEEFAEKYGWEPYEESQETNLDYDEWHYTDWIVPCLTEQVYQIAIDAEVDSAMKDEVEEGLQALRTATIKLNSSDDDRLKEFAKANERIDYLADKARGMGNHDLTIKILKTATQIIEEERHKKKEVNYTMYVVEIGTKAEGLKIISNFDTEYETIVFMKAKAREAKNDLDYCKVSKLVGTEWETIYDFNQKSTVAQFMILTGKRPGGIRRAA